MITLAFPYAFALLILPWLVYYLLPAVKGLYGDALRIPFIADLKNINIKSKGLWRTTTDYKTAWSAKFLYLYLIWGLLCLALSRPQVVGEAHPLPDEGRDIMLVLDISTSMLETDFSYRGHRMTRLDAVKHTVADFVKKRASDRVGLILFGTRAYLQAPLTYDKSAVQDILYSMQAGMAGDSTSIGDALALALKNMRLNKQPDSQVIVLLTDGENNDGSLSMSEAIKLAKQENIKIYTIGVGSPNLFFKMLTAVGLQGIDETELKELAETTKGQYFRAASASDLQKVYQMIDALEPMSKEDRYVQEVREVYYIPLLAAWILSLIAILMQRGQKDE